MNPPFSGSGGGGHTEPKPYGSQDSSSTNSPLLLDQHTSSHWFLPGILGHIFLPQDSVS